MCNRLARVAVLVAAMLACAPVFAQFQNSGSITTAAGSAVQVPFVGQGCVGIVITGAWTGTLAAQQSNDGTSWQPADMLQQLVGKWVETAGSDGRYYSGGYSALMFQIAGPTASGTANVTLQTSPLPCNLYSFAIPASIAGNGFSALAATATQTSVADAISGEKQVDVFVTWAGITGAPAGCTIQVQGSGNGATYLNAATSTPVTPGTNISFSVGAGNPLGLAVLMIYACTTYPTGGTITGKMVYK